MLGMVIIGILMMAAGLFSIIKGKLPFIKKYSGVKKAVLHSRIAGGAVLLAGGLITSQYFAPIGAAALTGAILGICVLAVVLEILCKAI